VGEHSSDILIVALSPWLESLKAEAQRELLQHQQRCQDLSTHHVLAPTVVIAGAS